ncbi:hypothetical protein BKI52_22860 [marine bacterium AO1-C]|nr:hypothetical protein BKI52_22860 [marine bacterium AO1-C]
MGTWTAFYVQTSDVKKVEKTLTQLLKGSTFRVKHQQGYTNWPSKWTQEEGIPEFMAIGKGQEDWVTIKHNTFDKLEHWAAFISEELATTVIVSFAHSVSGLHYLAIHQSGRLIKETGELLMNDIIGYVRQYGLQMEFDYSETRWTTIDLGPEGGETVGDLEQKILNPTAKPWWKFW